MMNDPNLLRQHLAHTSVIPHKGKNNSAIPPLPTLVGGTPCFKAGGVHV